MRPSLRDLFKILNPALDIALLSETNKKLITQFLRKYPFTLTHQIYLEIPLTQPSLAADLAFVCATPGEMKTAASLLNGRPLLFTDQDQTQQKLIKLSSLLTGIRTLWFEYDLSCKRAHIPSVFFDTGDQKSSQLIQILNTLKNVSLSKTEQDFFKLCFTHLPENHFIKWIGLMFSRDTNTTRLTTSHLEINQAGHYLSKLKWKGWAEILGKARSLEHFKTTALSFDISDHIHPRLGMEFKSTEKNIPLVTKHWTSFIDFLIKEKLCVQELKNSLINLIHFKYDLGSTPDSPTLYLSKINHIKITSDNNKLEAKAYIYMGRLHSKHFTDKWLLNSLRSAYLASS